jgi:glycosyltransferase involved in cell wall biosynthesis
VKSIHIIAGLGADNGGPSYSVPRLCASLSQNGCEPALYSLREPGASPIAKATYFPWDATSVPVFSRLRISGALNKSLKERVGDEILVHNHGLWLMPNVYAGRAAKTAKKPLIVSPRGMLANAALQFSPLKKKMFWAALQRRAFEKAAVWHATSADEAEDIRTFGITAPIAVIPNGIDIPDYSARHTGLAHRRTLLFLSRLHPKKGLDVLIETWSRLELERPDWDLVIAGPDEGRYRARLEAQAEQLGCKRITFTGPVYGQDKADLLMRSDLFVLPTQNENFGLVVGEALAAGIPAIVTKGAPWQGLETEGCGWWIDHGVEPLFVALKIATSLPPFARKEMGLRGRAWVERDFGWDAIAADMVSVYRWVCDGKQLPSCVITK